MSSEQDDLRPPSLVIPKTNTGIRGFDEITEGGLPQGRPTLVIGASGAGKTLFAVEFLVRGAKEFGEPGVLLSFEESSADLALNVTSLGFDLPGLEQEGKLVVDAFRVDAAEIIATGSFDLEGLFLRLDQAVRAVGAKRVVLDTVEVLFSALGDEGLVRGEMNRLFRWLKERGLTTIVTGERGRRGQLTRFGIEEYVSDCVIVLDHRVSDDISTRRMRVVKYRGSFHGTNEYPFLITDQGMMVLPETSMGLVYDAPDERISTGLESLDEMLDGGVHRGSTTLVSGATGTGKTTIGAMMASAACARGEQVLFVSFEESPAQVLRNMASVGINLSRWVDAGLLRLSALRATTQGLEAHLGWLDRALDNERPTLVVLDALASLGHVGSQREVTSAVSREIDLVKSRGITSIVTSLTHDPSLDNSSVDISSLIDTWLLLRNTETDGERNRLLSIVKSRGTAHSNQVREFLLTSAGPELVDVFIGPEGVLTGSARSTQIESERANADARGEELLARRRALVQHQTEIEAQIAIMRAKIEADAEEIALVEAQQKRNRTDLAEIRTQASKRRTHRRTPSAGEVD